MSEAMRSSAEIRSDKFDKMGGRAQLKKVNKVFYDKVYDHPWMSLYFAEVDQQRIEDQQTDFMQGALGGAKCYTGMGMSFVHPHMNIDEEMFVIRETLLNEALEETGSSEALKEAWLGLDEKFKKTVVKNSYGDCKGRFPGDGIISFNKPKYDQNKFL